MALSCTDEMVSLLRSLRRFLLAILSRLLVTVNSAVVTVNSAVGSAVGYSSPRSYDASTARLAAVSSPAAAALNAVRRSRLARASAPRLAAGGRQEAASRRNTDEAQRDAGVGLGGRLGALGGGDAAGERPLPALLLIDVENCRGLSGFRLSHEVKNRQHPFFPICGDPISPIYE